MSFSYSGVRQSGERCYPKAICNFIGLMVSIKVNANGVCSRVGVLAKSIYVLCARPINSRFWGRYGCWEQH